MEFIDGETSGIFKVIQCVSLKMSKKIHHKKYNEKKKKFYDNLWLNAPLTTLHTDICNN